MNVWRQQAWAPLRWAGGLCGSISRPLIFLILQGSVDQPSIFLEQENGTACVGILHCCEYCTLFLFQQRVSQRTDGEFICALRLLENCYYWGRHKVGETGKGRRKPETPPTPARLRDWQLGFLCLLVCRLDVDIFWLWFCTLPLDACLVRLKGRVSSFERMWMCLGEPRGGPGRSCRKRGQQAAAGSRLPCTCLLCCPPTMSNPSTLPLSHNCVTVNILCLQYGKINASSTIFKSLYDESGWGIFIHICGSFKNSILISKHLHRRLNQHYP